MAAGVLLEARIAFHDQDVFLPAGAGQDAEIFNFVTDVDSGQRAEIRIMQTMLGEKP